MQTGRGEFKPRDVTNFVYRPMCQNDLASICTAGARHKIMRHTSLVKTLRAETPLFPSRQRNAIGQDTPTFLAGNETYNDENSRSAGDNSPKSKHCRISTSRMNTIPCLSIIRSINFQFGRSKI